MPLTAGIVGLPNVGKSTLFNAITKQIVLAANYPFATIDPNVGVVTVPDERLAKLEAVYNPKKTTPTTFEFTDIAGLVKGASLGEGLGNQFLSHIREVDAICQVVRCFENNDIIHVEGEVDPTRDIGIINTELMLSDIETIDKRLYKIEKKALKVNDKEGLFEVALLKKIKENLEQDIPARTLTYNDNEKRALKNISLLTLKPVIYIANVNEDEFTSPDNEAVLAVKEIAQKENASVVKVSAEMEAELSVFSDEERIEYLEASGIKETGLDNLIKATYKLLGLETFFTAGPNEVRAWTFVRGSKAPECGGIIHTDMMRGFIKAEVMSFEDLIKYGSELKTKEAGKLRIEGKDYEIKDGDICHFRFNVT